MEPDASKKAVPVLPASQTEQPASVTVEPEFSEAELREMSAFLDGDVMSLLNLC
jgi:hypothetical protein